jgi:predicted SnoaL-like aldol condensation-catalyzing enzyme
MSKTQEEKNKSTVLEAFETLFNKHDYAKALNFWSPNYIQHSAHIPPGREGLFELVKNAPATLYYENHLTVADGDFVMLHGRFSGLGEGKPSWIVVDIVRMENGLLAEHWDVIEDEVTKEASVSGLPMFGDAFSTLGK